MKKIFPILSLIFLIVLNYSCKKDVECPDCIEVNAEIVQFCSTGEWSIKYEIDSLTADSYNYAENLPTSFLEEGKKVFIKFKYLPGGFTCDFIAVPLRKIELFDIEEL